MSQQTCYSASATFQKTTKAVAFAAFSLDRTFKIWVNQKKIFPRWHSSVSAHFHQKTQQNTITCLRADVTKDLGRNGDCIWTLRLRIHCKLQGFLHSFLATSKTKWNGVYHGLSSSLQGFVIQSWTLKIHSDGLHFKPYFHTSIASFFRASAPSSSPQQICPSALAAKRITQPSPLWPFRAATNAFSEPAWCQCNAKKIPIQFENCGAMQFDSICSYSETYSSQHPVAMRLFWNDFWTSIFSGEVTIGTWIACILRLAAVASDPAQESVKMRHPLTWTWEWILKKGRSSLHSFHSF